MDDLGVLIGIAGGEVAAAREDLVRAEPVGDPSLEALVALAAPPEMPVRRKLEQRSWQLMERARNAKRVRSLENEVAAASSRREQVENVLAVASAVSPAAFRVMGIRAPRRGMDATRAEVVSILALRPTYHGDDAIAKTQRRAVSTVAAAAEAMQAKFVCRVFRPPSRTLARARPHLRRLDTLV